MTTRRTWLAGLAGAVMLAASPPTLAQTPNQVVIVREVDSQNYDPHRTTARAGAEVIFMLADTLVSLDFDMRTIREGLARSWTVSPDGKTYTFNLRDDVTFCDGKRMTAEDVVFSFRRWVNPDTRSPARWRAGEVREIVATGPHTVEYRLNAPYSDLLYQLTQSWAVVVDPANVQALGNDFGVRGFNGTGPFCWVDWRPRNDMTLRRNPNYRWGPPMYENRGPAQVETVVWRVVPEETTRLAAVTTGQSHLTQYVPYSGLAGMRQNRNLRVADTNEAFWTFFIGFKIDKEVVSDPIVRRALVMAVDQEAISKELNYGETEPAFSYVHPLTRDWDRRLEPELIRTNVAEANRLLDQAGWVRGADGIRVKNGVRLSPLAYGFSGSTWQKLMEFIQGDLRKIGVDMRVQLFDATVAWGRLATQEFDMFGMSFPYITTGETLNLYFRSQNIPTPNRMNWRREDTDQLLNRGNAALSDEERFGAFSAVLRQVHEAAVWIPLYHEANRLVSSARLAPMRAHNIYGAAIYKGLDIRFVR